MATKKVLILYAHPAHGRSEVNAQMAAAAGALHGVTLVDLYEEYPDYFIDVGQEQAQLLKHDVICFQFPFYWYSTPSMLKEWQDLVLEYGFAYGTNGTKLAGKTFFCALTAGGPEKAYKARGYNHFTLRELLAPLEQTASLCGMHYLPPYALFSARSAVEQGKVDAHRDGYLEILEALRDDRISLQAAGRRDLLNGVSIRDASNRRDAPRTAGKAVKASAT